MGSPLSLKRVLLSDMKMDILQDMLALVTIQMVLE
ncbi:Uncharacterised protein [Mannheimia haemolytica]|nr:Uncharacterised protein [Mannheimia haemolytica]